MAAKKDRSVPRPQEFSQNNYLEALSEEIRHLDKERAVHLQEARLPRSEWIAVVTPVIVVSDIERLADARRPAECVLAKHAMTQGVVVDPGLEIYKARELISGAK